MRRALAILAMQAIVVPVSSAEEGMVWEPARILTAEEVAASGTFVPLPVPTTFDNFRYPFIQPDRSVIFIANDHLAPPDHRAWEEFCARFPYAETDDQLSAIADVLARHHRQRGEDVFFLTGTDEHGEPVALAAEAQGVTPREVADKNAERFKALAPQLNATNDFFIRTSDLRHVKAVQEILTRVKDNGFVRLGRTPRRVHSGKER